MIVIEVQKGESIEKALKRYKYKVIKTKQIDMLRERQEFVKKSVTKRMKKQKAKYKQYLQHIDTK
jgi:small subunit ribosomal protein S21